MFRTNLVAAGFLSVGEFRREAGRAALFLLLALPLLAQPTRLSWDQVQKIPTLNWSRNTGGQYVNVAQVRAPDVSIAIGAPDRIDIQGAGWGCQVRPIRPGKPAIIQVAWQRGRLAIFAGVWDSGVYWPTPLVVNGSSPCQTSETVAGAMPADVNGWLFFAVIGMPDGPRDWSRGFTGVKIAGPVWSYGVDANGLSMVNNDPIRR